MRNSFNPGFVLALILLIACLPLINTQAACIPKTAPVSTRIAATQMPLEKFIDKATDILGKDPNARQKAIDICKKEFPDVKYSDLVSNAVPESKGIRSVKDQTSTVLKELKVLDKDFEGFEAERQFFPDIPDTYKPAYYEQLAKLNNIMASLDPMLANKEISPREYNLQTGTLRTAIATLEKNIVDNGFIEATPEELASIKQEAAKAGIDVKSDVKAQALLDAHKVGEGIRFLGTKNPDGTYSKNTNPELAYTAEEIAQKAKILRAAGFDEAQTRILMEHGVVGAEYSLRDGIKLVVKKDASSLTQEDKNLILNLDDSSLRDLRETLGSKNYKKLEKLVEKIQPAPEQVTENGPLVSEKEYANLEKKIGELLATRSALTGKTFAETGIGFVAQGSLVDGWSYYKNRPSDAVVQGKKQMSDLDLLVVVEDPYWNKIPASEKITERIPRTEVLDRDNAARVDPSLTEIIKSLETLSIGGKLGRQVNVVIMPKSSFEMQDSTSSRLIYQNKASLNDAIEVNKLKGKIEGC
jgi:hypothetical protein